MNPLLPRTSAPPLSASSSSSVPALSLLPRPPRSAGVHGLPCGEPVAKGSTPPTILVVDDATTVRMFHQHLLAQPGWTVTTAVNGVDALEQVLGQGEGRPFDLYVVDVNMPKMDGLRLVRELRLLPMAMQAPVIMVSTESRKHDAQMATRAGANAYLLKPVRPQDLVLTAALLLGDLDTAAACAASADEATLPRHPGVASGSAGPLVRRVEPQSKGQP